MLSKRKVADAPTVKNTVETHRKNYGTSHRKNYGTQKETREKDTTKEEKVVEESRNGKVVIPPKVYEKLLNVDPRLTGVMELLVEVHDWDKSPEKTAKSLEGWAKLLRPHELKALVPIFESYVLDNPGKYKKLSQAFGNWVRRRAEGGPRSSGHPSEKKVRSKEIT
jgi:hypothetical protein